MNSTDDDPDAFVGDGVCDTGQFNGRYDNYADRAHNGCVNDYHDDGSCGGSAGYEPDHCSSNYCGPDHGCTRYDGEATGDNGCAIIIDRRSGR